MTLVRSAVAAAFVVALAGIWQPASAQAFSLQLGGPRFGLSIGAYPYYYRPWYPHMYRRYYRPSRCVYWGDRCAANWGFHNRNFYGCMRYYGCR